VSDPNTDIDTPHPPEGKRPAAFLAPDLAVRPDASDFIEQPEFTTEPVARESLPGWLYILCGIALFFAGSSFAGIEFDTGYYDEGMGAPVVATLEESTVTAPLDPAALGKSLYNGNCANCHQASGAGQPGAYPPMVGSEYVLGSKGMLAAILLDGVQGPLTVEKNPFGSNVMPAWANLSDEKLADIMTYIRKSWGNTADEVKPEDVAAVRAMEAKRTTPWGQSDLDGMKNMK
jgi:mono/diheme cytochrome c family protein